MTERERATIDDVLSAMQSFSATYHDVHVSVEALRSDLKAHDTESRRDRAGIREMVNALQRSVDRRFDAIGRELDEHSDKIATLEAARAGLMVRLADVEARIRRLEQA